MTQSPVSIVTAKSALFARTCCVLDTLDTKADDEDADMAGVTEEAAQWMDSQSNQSHLDCLMIRHCKQYFREIASTGWIGTNLWVDIHGSQACN